MARRGNGVDAHGEVESNLLARILGHSVEASLLVGSELVGEGSGRNLGDEAGVEPAGESGQPHDGCGWG